MSWEKYIIYVIKLHPQWSFLFLNSYYMDMIDSMLHMQSAQITLPFRITCSAPQSKNAVCALKINCKLFPFPLEKSWRNKQTINISTLSNMCKYNLLAWEWIKVKLKIVRFNIEVYTLLNKWTYCVFTLYGSALCMF